MASRRSHRCSSALLPIAIIPVFAFEQSSVLTFHNDNLRTGQYLSESLLTPQNVRFASFGKTMTLPVDGKVDAQPLVVSGVTIRNKGVHNVVFVATEHASLYGFDADTGVNYWQVVLLEAGETSSDPRGCGQVSPEIGITATPVIDPLAGPHGVIYVVAMSKDSANNYHQRLHAIDITTGAEQPGSPVDIQANYPGTGDNSVNGSVVFDPKQYKARPGLLLVNGVVYTSWSSHCDFRPYTGWTIGYNQTTLAQTSVFNFTPNGNAAAVWGAGAGASADSSGNLFFQLGNGTFDTTLDALGFPGRGDFGNAFVKLSLVGGGLKAVDYWTMFNTVAESNADVDLGSGGVLLLPDVVDAVGGTRHLGMGAGKDGNIYLFDRDNMGKFNPSNNGNIYQQLPSALGGGQYSSPAWFNGLLYVGSAGDVIRAYKMTAGRLGVTPWSSTLASFTYPGATPSISANGTANAILWAVENSNPAVLHAYDANNLLTELYNSSQAAGNRDQFGVGNKFITPTVANGKVYVGTSNSIAVFGLLPPTPDPVPVVVGVSPASGSGLSQTFTFSFSDTGGAADLDYVQVLLTPGVLGTGACWIHYSQRYDLVDLINDSATAGVGPAPPGYPIILSNSQCALDVGATTVTLQGTGLAVVMPVTFKPGFSGPQTVFLRAINLHQANTGWQSKGNWTVTSAMTPAVVSLSPAFPTGPTQTLTFTFSDTGGASNLDYVQVLVSPSSSGSGSCWIHYSRRYGLLDLINDSATAAVGPAPAGYPIVLSNSQCALEIGAASVTSQGTLLTVVMPVTIKPAYSGSKLVFMRAINMQQVSTGWQVKGTWTP